MSKKAIINTLLIAAMFVVFVVSFVIGGTHTNPEERFGGTDDAATTQIQKSDPGYEPWFHSFFEPESSEVESGLFALQAAIGGAVLGFAIGGLWGRRHLKTAQAPKGPRVPGTTEALKAPGPSAQDADAQA